MKRIYLDYAATGPVSAPVKKAMEPYISGIFGNPRSLHSFGREAEGALDKAREIISKEVGIGFHNVVFTGSATEANNLAFRGVVARAKKNLFGTGNLSAPAADSSLGSRASDSSVKNRRDQARQHSETFLKDIFSPLKIVISAIEHNSVFETAKMLEKEGVEVVCVPVDEKGFVNLEILKKELDERTVLVSIIHGNNEIGTIQPIEKISEIIKRFRGKNEYPLLHTDAVQSFQFLECNMGHLGVDLMTLSAHKMYGPKGVGALCVKNEKILAPIITGGGQEFGLRSGTQNVGGIAGFARALEIASKKRVSEKKRIQNLKRFFLSGLKKIYSGTKINGVEGENSLPHVLNVCFCGRSAEELLVRFDLSGIAVSAGSACGARGHKPSRIIQALGNDPERERGSIRFSFGAGTSFVELKDALRRIEKILKQVFPMSDVGKLGV